MTSLLPPSNSYITIAVKFPVVLEGIIVLSLIGLLVLKELLRAYDEARLKLWNRKLNIAITCLFAAFSLIVILRFLRLLNLG